MSDKPWIEEEANEGLSAATRLVISLMRELGAARVEHERLKELYSAAMDGLNECDVKNERLRAVTNRYFDVLERQQVSALGEEARELIVMMEQMSEGTRELADARDAVYDALVRHKCR